MPKISDEVYEKCLVDAAKAGDMADVVRAVRVLSGDDSFGLTRETMEKQARKVEDWYEEQARRQRDVERRRRPSMRALTLVAHGLEVVGRILWLPGSLFFRLAGLLRTYVMFEDR